jgi:hypothetical protein
VIVVALYALGASAEAGNPFRRALTTWWFNDPLRLASLVTIAAAPLVVVAVDRARTALAARRSPQVRTRVVLGTAALLLLALVSLERAPVREHRMDRDYAPDQPAAAALPASGWLLR